MKRLILLFCLLTPILSNAQSTSVATAFLNNFKKAEHMYAQLAYRNALPLYLAVTEKEPNNYLARQRIADCYFRLGNYDEAEKWYGELASLSQGDPIYKYQYAQILSIQKKYGDAEKWFGEYRALAVGDPRAASKSDFIYFISYYMRDSVLYTLRNEPFNSDQSDFAPQYYKNGIVFVSARDRDLFIKRQSLSALNDEETMLNVFFAPPNAAQEQDAQLFYHEQLNSPYHDGPIAFFDGGKGIAFSRSNVKKGKESRHAMRVNLKLFLARLNDQQQVTDTEEFPFNHDSYSIGHPWVSEDGNTLYFSSDMPGGAGGTDIYKCARQDGKWNTPENVGPFINTMGDEFFPYVANDTTLYFSSNGHGGLGGLDIYITYKQHGAYSLAKNLGFPLNTSSDDFALILDGSGRKGMFSSNREGTNGYDDIYSFVVNSFFLNGKAIERSDSTRTVAGARLTAYDELGKALDSTISDPNGNFNFDLAFDRNYSFTASKNGYSWIDSLKFSTHARALGQDTLLAALWKHQLFAMGSIYSNESQHKLSEVTVVLENITDGVTDSIVTNNTGSYRFLVIPNKQYHIYAHKEGFLPKDFVLNTNGLYQEDLVNDFLLEEEFIDKVVIQFDFDKAGLREPEIPKLEEVKNILLKRARATLKISAFADSNGETDYNQNLSDRRAQSTLHYFISFGINKDRIEATGFGETLLLNLCSDGVVCTEEEHSKNRRAELKVQVEAGRP